MPDSPINYPKPEKYLCFKEVRQDGDISYFETPHHDSMVYETPINFIFDSVEEATQFAINFVNQEVWGFTAEEASEWVIVEHTETMVASLIHIKPGF